MNKTVLTRFFRIFILAGFLLSSLAACKPAAHQDSIAVSGAFALYPLMVRWSEEFQKANPNIHIDVTAGGAGKGMTDALTGAADIGMVSREIKTEETSQDAFGIAVARDAVFLVINAKNPYLTRLFEKGLTKKTLASIYLAGEVKTWGDVLGDSSIIEEIHIYTRSDACGASEMWSKFLGGDAQEDLKGVGVSGDPAITEAVAKDPLGIGYNNLNYAFDPQSSQPVTGVVVLPIDINANGKADANETFKQRDQAMTAVSDGAYPSPPARVLYLVTKGKPTGVTGQFIQWILNEGQGYVGESGYISLPDSQLKSEKEKF